MDLEELEDGEDDVVDIAKSRSFAALRVVEPAGPIDGDVGAAAVEFPGGANRSASVGLAVVEEAVEYGAVIGHVKSAEDVSVEVPIGGGRAEEGDVVVGVEAEEVSVAGRNGAKDPHPVEEAVSLKEGVGHPDPVRLHRVPLPVVVISYLRLVVVAHPPLPCVCHNFQRHSAKSMSPAREKGRRRGRGEERRKESRSAKQIRFYLLFISGNKYFSRFNFIKFQYYPILPNFPNFKNKDYVFVILHPSFFFLYVPHLCFFFRSI